MKEKIVENKKEDISDYMKAAVALIHQYVPPGPQQIQAAKEAKRIAMNPQPDGKARLVISQYLKPGDSLTIDMDPPRNRGGSRREQLRREAGRAVTLAVQMASLPDGAIYAKQTTLDAKAKNITVVIQNAGHRPVQP